MISMFDRNGNAIEVGVRVFLWIATVSNHCSISQSGWCRVISAAGPFPRESQLVSKTAVVRFERSNFHPDDRVVWTDDVEVSAATLVARRARS